MLARVLDPSGAFSFDNVPPGRRRVQMTGADGFFATQITAEGVAINGPVIEIVPGATIQLSIEIGRAHV